jgi:hypothetical protein
MSKASEDQKLFKLILAAISAQDLQTEDYQVALSSLRDGNMVRILEQILAALSSPADQKIEKVNSKPADSKYKPVKSRQGDRVKDPDSLFEDVKRRKITRDRLESIIKSLDGQFLDANHANETMRNLISTFYQKASDRQWLLLTSIVNGNYEVDPYLDNMTKAQ